MERKEEGRKRQQEHKNKVANNTTNLNARLRAVPKAPDNLPHLAAVSPSELASITRA